MKLQSINRERRLYVMPCGNGYSSCYGFDVLDQKAKAVAAWAKVIPPATDPGTISHFEDCARIINYGAKFAAESGTRCEAELTPQLIGREGKQVEVLDCYGERRRFRVGKSTGWLPCHLELANVRSTGGGAVTGAPFKELRVIR